MLRLFLSNSQLRRLPIDLVKNQKCPTNTIEICFNHISDLSLCRTRLKHFLVLINIYLHVLVLPNSTTVCLLMYPVLIYSILQYNQVQTEMYKNHNKKFDKLEYATEALGTQSASYSYLCRLFYTFTSILTCILRNPFSLCISTYKTSSGPYFKSDKIAARYCQGLGQEQQRGDV